MLQTSSFSTDCCFHFRHNPIISLCTETDMNPTLAFFMCVCVCVARLFVILLCHLIMATGGDGISFREGLL